MAKEDYYSILGVSKSADLNEIKRAYRKKAMKFHPDKNPGDKEAEHKFKEATEAYQVLSDEEKRSRYDRFGHEGLAGMNPGGAGGFSSMEDIFSDIFGSSGGFFSDLFGGGGQGGRSGPARGHSLKCEIAIDFKDVLDGCERTIEIARNESCPDCRGSGARAGTSPTTCPSCGGRGVVTQKQGFFTMRVTCPRCHGSGTVIESPCGTCHGSGLKPQKREITVNVPPGVEEGTRMRVAGEGEPGERGGPRGDLYVYIGVSPHPFLVRDGDDVVCEVPVSFSQAALGAAIEVPTIKGKADINIPPGTQPGQVIRLRGLGFPNVHGYGRGSQLVRVKLVVPKKLTDEQEKLLREFAATEEANVSPERKGFFENLKKYFG